MQENTEVPHANRAQRGRAVHTREILIVAGGTVALILCVVLLSVRAAHGVNRIPLATALRPVTVVAAQEVPYVRSRMYVGAIEPWVEASVGPQYISGYVETVLVRPGAVVARGDVLATLDCSNPNAATRAVEMRARAVDAQMRAAGDEATRLTTMLEGGFVSPNDVEQKTAVSTAAQAQLLETKANLLRSSLDVRDCVLRAPFDGEIGTRTVDPGAFVRPGASIVSIVDRNTVRVTVDAPEKDFDALAPSKVVQIDLLATDAHLSAPIARRAPRADPKTRTIHVEVDVSDPERQYPVGTTAIVRAQVGQPVPATRIPIYAATQDQGKARLFVVDRGIAHARTLPVLGEVGGDLFFAPSALPAGSLVVTEGRALLSDGDAVDARADAEAADGGAPKQEGATQGRGGGYGRPL
jgi:membrane fusion protein (multidrug efflux system)